MKNSFDHLTTRQQLNVPIIAKALLDEMDSYLQGKTSACTKANTSLKTFVTKASRFTVPTSGS